MDKKNPKTKSYIWTAMVLQEGHEGFCQKWLRNACVQLTDSGGNTSFVPIVPNWDPDMTVHEDLNQIPLNQDGLSQGPLRKLELGSSQLPVGKVVQANTTNVEGDQNPVSKPFVLLDPNDVFRMFSDLQCSTDEPNCSATAAPEVIF